MYDGNEKLPRKVRFLPFVFGGLTGESIALVVVAACVSVGGFWGFRITVPSFVV